MEKKNNMLEEYKLNGMEKQKNSSVQWKNKSISTKAATFEDNIVFTRWQKYINYPYLSHIYL